MKKKGIVIPAYILKKECRDEDGHVKWEKRWYFHEWQLGELLEMYLGADMFWLPGQENSTVSIIKNGLLVDSRSSLYYGKCGQPLDVDGCVREECNNCVFGDGSFL